MAHRNVSGVSAWHLSALKHRVDDGTWARILTCSQVSFAVSAVRGDDVVNISQITHAQRADRTSWGRRASAAGTP